MRSVPVFLHSSWRAASTYVWAKFRAIPQAYCYFEPLNEHLATATQRLIDRHRPWSYAHHPKLDAPYLEEFRPLIRAEGGVPGFPAELTYGRYRLDRTAVLPELERYFATLADFARCHDKTPVFGMVRSDLRMGWFRHHVPGTHIFIRRHPRRQFMSCLRQMANGNPYFIERWMVILGNNRDDPAFGPLLTLVDVPAYAGEPQLRDLFYRMQARQAPMHHNYMMFYFLHLLATRDLPASCDLVIDVDRLGRDPEAVEEIEARIAEETGAQISFADCRPETYESSLDWSAAHFARLESIVEQVL
jgi:hypothetical protein